MVNAVAAHLFLWSLEISGIITIAAVMCWFFRNKPSNIHSTVLTVAVICIWLIPFSPLLIHPFTQQPFFQSAIAYFNDIYRDGYSLVFPTHHSEETRDYTPRTIKKAGQTNAAAANPENRVDVLRPKETPPLLVVENNAKDSLIQRTIHSIRSNDSFLALISSAFLCVWLAGAIVFFVRWISSWWSVSRIVASSQDLQNTHILELIERIRQLLFIHKKIKTKQTDFPIAPFIKGIRHPVLVLPVSLLDETSLSDIKAIIAHELAHLRRYDLEIHQLIRFLKIVFWFVPPIWWLQQKVYNSQDMASDECAAVVLGSGLDIGEALTHLAEYYLVRNVQYSLTGFMENKHVLLQRLDNITSTPVSQLTRIPLRYHFLFLTVSILILTCTGVIGTACMPSSVDGLNRDSVQSNPYGQSLQYSENPKPLPPTKETTITFAPAIPFAEQTTLSSSMDIGDLNGDGYADIVYGTDVGEGKSVFLNQKGQALIPGQEFFGKRDRFPATVLADVDRDGDRDIITAQYYKPNQVFLNDGKGSFGRGSRIGEANSFTENAIAGDFDGDGFPDIAQYNRTKPCKIFWNDGKGSFISETSLNRQGYDHASFLAVDYDRDGDLDLAISPLRENAVLLYENRGNKQFMEHRKSLPANRVGSYIKILSRDILQGNANNLLVFLFDKNEGFIYRDTGDSTLVLQTQFAQTLYPLHNDMKALDTGDVDGDGDIDFVIGNDQQPIQLYLNEDNRQFAHPIPIGRGGVITNSIRMADMDSDGDLDIVTGNLESPGTIYRNEMPIRVKMSSPHENAILKTNPECITLQFSHLMKSCDSSNIFVMGSLTGFRTGRYQLIDGKTLRFYPNRPFLPGETVQIIITQDAESSTKERLPHPYLASFTMGVAPGLACFDGEQCTFGPDFSRARSLSLGDLNGDGYVDIVTGSDETGCQAYFNNGAGHFGKLQPIAQTKEDTLCTMVCDIDNDGDMDVLAGNSDRYPNKIFLNDGRGRFPEAVIFQGSHGNSSAVTAGDINGDGRIDVVFANNVASEGDHRIYLNRGKCRFREFIRLGKGLISICDFALADLNGNHALDLITTGWGGSNYHLHNDGNGNFRNDFHWLFGASGAALCVGDFDSDEDIDLVGLRYYEQHEEKVSDIVFLRNLGLDKFEQTVIAEMEEKQNDIQAGDIDGDGDLDFLLSSARKGPELILFRNAGNGEFNRETLLETVSPYPPQIAIGDLDGDGKLDIVTAKYGGRNSIYFQRDSSKKIVDGRE